MFLFVKDISTNIGFSLSYAQGNDTDTMIGKTVTVEDSNTLKKKGKRKKNPLSVSQKSEHSASILSLAAVPTSSSSIIDEEWEFEGQEIELDDTEAFELENLID